MAPRWLWTNFGRGKLCLVGGLCSEPRLALSQTGYATFFRRLDEVAGPGGREYGPRSDLKSYTLTFALQRRKITETAVSVTEKRLADQRRKRFIYSNWPSLAMASTSLLSLAALGFASGYGVNLRSAQESAELPY